MLQGSTVTAGIHSSCRDPHTDAQLAEHAKKNDGSYHFHLRETLAATPLQVPMLSYFQGTAILRLEILSVETPYLLSLAAQV